MTATALNVIDLKTGLPHTGLTAHEHVGFELGWDYAHYRVTPPAPYTQEPSPLRQGLLAGQAVFGTRTLAATRHVRKWLQLRLHAWLRGRSVELVQVTPNYLQQIDASHCPITRVALSSATLEGSDASIDRVRNDAGYAAGNLAVMSTKANHAKAAFGLRDAQRFVLVVARRGDEREMGPVWIPLDVRPLSAAAGDVVAERRAVRVGRHLKPDDARRVSAQIDDHARNRRDRHGRRAAVARGAVVRVGRGPPPCRAGPGARVDPGPAPLP